ncbi:MAG TPA: response regulator [Casimicrobiaceae bacterium]
MSAAEPRDPHAWAGPASAGEALQEPAGRTPARLLIVDDTPLNLKLLGDLLAAKGYAVTTASNGEEALARLASEVPDLVLLDVMMPGLSGYDVCRRIRASEATALLPVVMVTSLDPQHERIHGIEAGADDFLSKPINQPELIARVRSLLRIKSLQDEVQRQTAALKEWNVRLEERVREQVAQLERLSQLKRFFAPAVADAIVSTGEQSILTPHRREICYVFLDLRGFTAFTDAAEPEEVQAVLGDYHAAMGRLIAEHQGTLDRFAGDGILVFFNDPLPTPEPGKRAARMALAMRARFAELRTQWQSTGYDLDLGMGIARGYATLGAFGYEGRFDYTAVGRVVNLAARLCGEAKPGQILLDQRARAALGDEFGTESMGPIALKGFGQPVPAFALIG